MIRIKVLIMAHFEIGEMSGDYPGEAQYFYERYLVKSTRLETVNGYPIYINEENHIALGLTGEGKINSVSCLTGILADSRFDFSECYILGVGCAGGNTGKVTVGDVIIETGACDFDMGHHADYRDMRDPNTKCTWFPVPVSNETNVKHFNLELVNKAYKLTKDMSLETTAATRAALKRNFPGEEWAVRDPKIVLGAAVSSDNYWKGLHLHKTAGQIAGYYNLPGGYACSEMEDIGLADAAAAFGLLSRFICIRVICNLDVFLDGDCPERLWGMNVFFNDNITEENKETIDAFVPCMRNLAKVGCEIIDKILL